MSSSVTVMNGRALARQRHPGRRLGLGEGGREVARDAHHLAGRAHLRAEQRIRAFEAVERQHGLLDRDVLSIADPLLAPADQALNALAEHDPAGELRERDADGLGDERDGPRGTRVDLDHVQLAGVDGVLHVDEADDADRERDLAGGRAHLLKHLAPQRVRREHAGAVAGVHAGLLDVLHDPADPDLLPSQRASTSSSLASSRKRSRKMLAAARPRWSRG